jgi:N1-acetylpolyamine oxidase
MSSSKTPIPDAAAVFDAIIIGAGISGLACASRLTEHLSKTQNARRILVLEARHRIGGRIGTVYVNECRLDTGANWIHGIGTKDEPNPLMGIIPEKRIRSLNGSIAFKPPPPPKGLEGEEVDVEGNGKWEDLGATVDHGKDGKAQAGDLVLPAKVSQRLMGTMWELFGTLHEIAASTPADDAKQTTMLKAITETETFRNAFNDLEPQYHEALRALPQFVEGMEAAPLAAQSAEGEADRPGMSLLEYAIEDFDGDQVFVQDGYLAVVEALGKDTINGGAVKLGVEVNEIDWDTSPIQVKTKDGQCFAANDVVCTLPLGVLKAEKDNIFKPSLPKAKSEAIDSLGFGTLDKIFMVYDRPWWTQEPFSSILKKGLSSSSSEDNGQTTFDSLMGFTHSLPGISISPSGSTKPGVRSMSLINLHSLTGFPVLSCFVSCANAQDIESHSDERARDLIHNSLRTWLGKEPPRPVGVHVTRWASDEFSRGSYSHMIAGLSETAHRVEFQQAEEVSNAKKNEDASLGFAGEHTSRNHFATVHGALISGWREAGRIIERWESKK